MLLLTMQRAEGITFTDSDTGVEIAKIVNRDSRQFKVGLILPDNINAIRTNAIVKQAKGAENGKETQKG